MFRLLTILFLTCSYGAIAQLQSIDFPIKDNLPRYTHHPQAKTKYASSPVKCGEDTLEYARYKGSAFQAIAVSDGYALGQYYDAPDTVTISGMTFYGWTISTNDDSVTVTVSLYEAGADTLPVGNPIRSKQITLDTTFGGGVLTVLRKSIAFDSAYTTTKPFILTIESSDSLRAGVVANSYNSRDGEGENLACGTVNNVWYRSLNLNIGGTALDCDILLEPHVSYSTYADFSVKNCFNPNDSVLFENNSSPILSHRMYNRYIAYDLGRFSHYWYFGLGAGSLYDEEPKYKFRTINNFETRLVTTMYSYRAGNSCRDTAYQTLDFQPSEIIVSVDTPVCSGSSTTLFAGSTGTVKWYPSYSDTSFFNQGSSYKTPVLDSSVQYYVRAENKNCFSQKVPVDVAVAQTPSLLSTTNDSICLNARANLSATVSSGNVIWWDAATGGNPVDTGFVYITDPLNSSQTFYAEGDNRGCKTSQRIAVEANVNAKNAPSEPITNTDTLVCIHDGEVSLKAYSTSGDQINWYDRPSGGSLIASGNTFTFDPQKLGAAYIYVEAFDGQCASSRIQKKTTVWTFPQKAIPTTDTLCKESTLELDFSNTFGNIKWYNADKSQLLYDSNFFEISNLQNSATYILIPYSNACFDTTEHTLLVEVVDPGTPGNISAEPICAEEQGILSATSNTGTIVWFLADDLTNPIATGNEFTTDYLNESTSFYVGSQNLQCISPLQEVALQVKPTPSASFNFQVNGNGNFTFEAVANGVTYLWDFGDGNTSKLKRVTHQYEFNSYFDVTLTTTASNGCDNASTRTVRAAGLPGSVETIENNALVQLYPNPTTSVFYINSKERGQLKLYNLQGKVVMYTALEPGENKVDIAVIPSGTYIVQLHHQGITRHTKIIKL
jgi:hypothetical protein